MRGNAKNMGATQKFWGGYNLHRTAPSHMTYLLHCRLWVHKEFPSKPCASYESRLFMSLLISCLMISILSVISPLSHLDSTGSIWIGSLVFSSLQKSFSFDKPSLQVLQSNHVTFLIKICFWFLEKFRIFLELVHSFHFLNS